MKLLVKAAFGAAALIGAALAAPAPAAAQPSFGIYFGTGPAYYGHPCYRPYYARPAYCFPRYRSGYYGRPYYGRPYYGRWYYGRWDRPYRYRDWDRGRDRRWRR